MIKSFKDFSFRDGILCELNDRVQVSEPARLRVGAPVNDYSCTAVRLAIQSFFAHLRQGFFECFTDVSA